MGHGAQGGDRDDAVGASLSPTHGRNDAPPQQQAKRANLLFPSLADEQSLVGGSCQSLGPVSGGDAAHF